MYIETNGEHRSGDNTIDIMRKSHTRSIHLRDSESTQYMKVVSPLTFRQQVQVAEKCFDGTVLLHNVIKQ